MRALPSFLVAATMLGCQPELGDPVSLVTGSRVLAIVAEPAEVKPGEVVHWRALAASGRGTIEDPEILWSFCASPKPLTENDAVSTACLGDGVRPISGPAGAIEASMPLDACALFGPDAPPGGFRPRDPDATGGFYQPVRARLGGLTAFALTRVTCNLPNAPIDVAIELEKRHSPNRNPTLAPLSASIDGAPVGLADVPAGARVRLETGWSEGDAETYAMFDPGSATIVERREALRVSWFVTAGELDDEVTGRGADDPALTTATTWRAPATRGAVHLWLVLRDGRGGVDFASYDIEVR